MKMKLVLAMIFSLFLASCAGFEKGLANGCFFSDEVRAGCVYASGVGQVPTYSTRYGTDTGRALNQAPLEVWEQ